MTWDWGSLLVLPCQTSLRCRTSKSLMAMTSTSRSASTSPFDPVHDRKRKRGGLMEEEINVFCSMTRAVKEMATSIKECKPLDVHPDLYGTVMTQGGFSDEALMAALSHLLDNKAQGFGFVAMTDTHRLLWLKSRLGKHYY
uniref:Uncharacterized protein n=1 Tax=Hordeum vulgare subsp. vulgare TaxID=112509 RepID=A0A8I6Y3K8_HORVV